MSLRDEITVLILTFNEEANIGRTLDAVAWAKRIVVVDSGSGDATAAIVARSPRAELVVRAFDTHDAQWNFGLGLCAGHGDWVLALDADYELSAALSDELRSLVPVERVAGYRAFFRYCIFGKPLRGSLYPPVVALYRKSRAHYVQVGHTHRIVVDGEIADLAHPILHDDRKPVARWLASQQRYARLEADHLLATPPAKLRRTDRLRRMGWPAPIAVFFYTLVAKRCLLDGWPGWLYVLQRVLAETMIALEIVDRRLRGESDV